MPYLSCRERLERKYRWDVLKVTVIEVLVPDAKSEGDLKRYLRRNPDIIEVGAEFLDEEFSLGSGRVDMVFLQDENVLFVELKRFTYRSKGHAERFMEQMTRYYISIVSMIKLFGGEEAYFKMYLILGYNHLEKNSRYEIEVKTGSLSKELNRKIARSRQRVFKPVKSYREKLHERKTELLDLKGNLIQEIKRLRNVKESLEAQILRIEAKKREKLTGYGDKVLYILPDFYYTSELDSRKCFVCGNRSEVVLQISENRTFGLCNKHFIRLSGFPLYISK